MDVQPDFRELLALFNKHGVEYIVVGGYALACHGAARFTGDIDVYVRPDVQNASRIVDAPGELGFTSVGLTREDFVSPHKVIQPGSG